MGVLARFRRRSIAPHEPPRLVWVENEFEIFRLAQQKLRWISAASHHTFWHPEGEEFVTAWPVRLLWGMWWMPEPHPEPASPAGLAEALDRCPPREPSWPAGSLIDPEAKVQRKLGEPWMVPVDPVLLAGTRVVAGRYNVDGCDGFDTQEATITSGEWAGTHVDLRVGRAGESYLIARLAIMPGDEPLVADAAAAATLLEELRGVHRSRPSG